MTAETKRAYAFRHCFKHYAIQKGRRHVTSPPSATRGKATHDLADTIADAPAPVAAWSWKHYGTRKQSVQRYRVFLHRHPPASNTSDTLLFSVKSRYKEGSQPKYSIFEVCPEVDLPPTGKTTTVARLRGMSLFYYDL
ncbi:hypothetical protein [Bacteroides acidifaciens]|uniref:hypothetical protein n=1 Tax=Bacteroides acidifaciens TaxID=85831 RepID=UPI003F68F64F